MQYSIVGTNFTKSDAFIKEQQPGVPVKLVREPTNKFDANAVMVWFGDRHVGYVPKNQNAALSLHIDEKGEDFMPPFKELAADEKAPAWRKLPSLRAIDGVFRLSPNSAFPQVEIEQIA